jgi:sterol O-acyltransferase
VTYFAEIIGSIIYTYCLFDRYCVPVFRDLKVKNMNWKTYVHLISISIMPGALMQLMIFFSLLHCWHNAFAEMMRFGDRQVCFQNQPLLTEINRKNSGFCF